MSSSSSSSSVSSISSSSSSPPSASASASGGSLKPSLLVILLILSITLLLSLSLCLLLRLLNRRCLRHLSTATSATTPTTTPTPSASNRLSCSSHRISPEISVIDSLPLFTFGSIKRPNHSSSSSSSSSFSADCAVCLSKFEADDQLRLLPLCCHAFHAHCIDTWLRSNQTCPLCRSPLLRHSSEADLFKALSSPPSPPPASAAAANVIINDHRHPPAAAGGSFRLEIGSLSHRRQAVPDSAAPASQERPRRSCYSVGSFEYIVEEGWSEISASATSIHSHSHRRSLCSSPDDKDISNINGGGGGGQLARNINDPTGIAVASDRDSEREAGGGRSWLKEYMDRLSSSYSFSISSRALSFRSSGRFFTGSSRRAITPTGNGTGDYDDVEAATAADGVGEEISELFRWFSGV